MTWYVEAVSTPQEYEHAANRLRPRARAHASTWGTAAPLRLDIPGVAAHRMMDCGEGVHATVHVSVQAVPGPRDRARVTVRACFWGDLATPGLGAPPAEARVLCQSITDRMAESLATHLSTYVRAELSGPQLH